MLVFRNAAVEKLVHSTSLAIIIIIRNQNEIFLNNMILN